MIGPAIPMALVAFCLGIAVHAGYVSGETHKDLAQAESAWDAERDRLGQRSWEDAHRIRYLQGICEAPK